MAEARAEYDLARHDAAVADVLRGAVGDHGDVVAVPQQAGGEVEAGLAGSDDEDSAHGDVSFPKI